ncbi:hypothetical protein [Prochlorococcus sp. MIT 1223]|uniref:hypothetical protein n=1 Tax=Prochlorococcus sp. MIT 1223 TaxID=3096217 RepID=UPI002A75CF04|nr:hypothetical protein [Prochlorococcus sp. MIT 1223]
MGKKSPVAIFMAATALLATSSLNANISHSAPKDKDIGGLKEWTTDQSIEDESKLDEAAKKAKKKAKKRNLCIPVGEGENCW